MQELFDTLVRAAPLLLIIFVVVRIMKSLDKKESQNIRCWLKNEPHDWIRIGNDEPGARSVLKCVKCGYYD